MPPLGRNARRLLKTVGRQPHAKDEDHENDTTSPPSSPLSALPDDEADITRDPESSSDELQVEVIEDAPIPPKALNGSRNAKGTPSNRAQKRGGTGRESESSLPDNRQQRLGSKRKRTEDAIGDEGPPDWMLSSSQAKRSKTYGSQSQKSQTSFKDARSKAVSPQKNKATFKRLAHPASSPLPEPAKPTFRRPAAATSTTASPFTPDFHPTIPSPGDSPLSSPPPDDGPEIEEIYLDVPDPSDFEPCPICSTDVSKDFRFDWELENLRGHRMNLRMQERFCRAHKEQDAMRAWKAARYPAVDWDALSTRLDGQRDRVEDILARGRKSSYRAELEARVKDKESRTVKKSHDAGGTRGRTGYYGSRGARVMTEYALRTFAVALKAAAAKDKVMASSGVAGGLSGFVQAVVVPELALGLIMEDMGVDEVRAKEVMVESEELGELVNAEEEDKAVVEIAAPASTYGANGIVEL